MLHQSKSFDSPFGVSYGARFEAERNVATVNQVCQKKSEKTHLHPLLEMDKSDLRRLLANIFIRTFRWVLLVVGENIGLLSLMGTSRVQSPVATKLKKGKRW